MRDEMRWMWSTLGKLGPLIYTQADRQAVVTSERSMVVRYGRAHLASGGIGAVLRTIGLVQ